MSLKLYFHPLSSFCWKALIALYENDTAFEPRIVDLMDPADNAAFKQIWPIGKFPVLRDDAKDRTIPESSIIIEYLAQHYPGRDAAHPRGCGPCARGATAGSLLRSLRARAHAEDRHGPAASGRGRTIRMASSRRGRCCRPRCGMIERDMVGKTWAVGGAFSMADCAAAPALFYADKVMPLGDCTQGCRGISRAPRSSGRRWPACSQKRSRISICSQARTRRRIWRAQHRDSIAA